MTEVHSIWMHNNWRSQCGWEGSRAIPEIGERWLSQAGWSTFLHFKWFFALFVGCFLFYWGILFLVLRNFPPFSKVQGQTSGCAAHSLPRWCSTLPQAPLPMLCPEPLPHQPLILMGLWWHQVVTHKSVNCSWASRARGHLFGELLSIHVEPEQAEGIFRDYLP